MVSILKRLAKSLFAAGVKASDGRTDASRLLVLDLRSAAMKLNVWTSNILSGDYQNPHQSTS